MCLEKQFHCYMGADCMACCIIWVIITEIFGPKHRFQFEVVLFTSDGINVEARSYYEIESYKCTPFLTWSMEKYNT